jgi:hypothetical protein
MVLSINCSLPFLSPSFDVVCSLDAVTAASAYPCREAGKRLSLRLNLGGTCEVGELAQRRALTEADCLAAMASAANYWVRGGHGATADMLAMGHLELSSWWVAAVGIGVVGQRLSIRRHLPVAVHGGSAVAGNTAEGRATRHSGGGGERRRTSEGCAVAGGGKRGGR